MPMAMLEASVSTINGMEKFGRLNTRVVVRIFFSFVKASCAFVSHVNIDYLSKFVSGEARVASPRMNF